MSRPAAWTCPSCGRLRKARFCADCGEERLRPRDLTLIDLTSRFAENVTSIDGKLVKSLRAVLTAPGTLTSAHVHGRRRGYLGPLALFFTANATFAMLQSLLGIHVLSSPLASHLHEQDWSGLAQVMVAHRLQAGGQNLGAYATVFDPAAAFNAKALMILMVLAFAPLPLALFRRQQVPVGAHIVYALHIYVFVLALLCGSLLLAELDEALGGEGLQSPTVDLVLSVFNLAACAWYIHASLAAAYGATGAARLFKAAIMAIAIAALFVGYRFTIFVITLYTT